MKVVVALLTLMLSTGFTAGPAVQRESAPHWRTLATEPYAKKRDDIVFSNVLTGFYGTGKGNLYRTQDGGRTWQLIWSKPGTFVRSLAFIDGRRGFLGNLGAGLAGITDTTPLYETKDGGVTWEAARIGSAAIPGVCSIDILKSRSIHEGDVSERYYIHAAGRANGPAKLLRSENGGETWFHIDLSDRAGMILDVKFLDPNIGFVFAGTSGDLSQSNALILKTTDGGRTWRQTYRSTRLNEIIWKASFVNNLVGYGTIQNDDPTNVQQRVVKTIDGGEHWSEMLLVSSKGAEELGVGFASPDKGWVGTDVGGFETSDGGKSWIASDLAPKANKIRVRTADGTPMVYAIGKAKCRSIDSQPLQKRLVEFHTTAGTRGGVISAGLCQCVLLPFESGQSPFLQNPGPGHASSLLPDTTGRVA
jgi:photosystem II stability/assembly factor-like uncharacterized protein